MKRLINWALAALVLAFLMVAAFGEAQSLEGAQKMIESAFAVNGNVWVTMTPREKAILVTGILGGLVASSYAEVARSAPGSGAEVFGRIEIAANAGQLVLRMDTFYAFPENRECCVALALMLRECEGGAQMARDLKTFHESDW